MRFWDTSALVPLLVDEPASRDMHALLRSDPDVVVWWGTEVECVSALARLEREGALAGPRLTDAIQRLDAAAAAWQEVEPTPRVRQSANRMLRVHPLRAADALQLAAAIAASEDNPAALPIVSFDVRLGMAAEREGFRVIRPDSG
jgi:predicted nucleic acid-binding protein